MSNFKITKILSPNVWKGRKGYTPDMMVWHQTTGDELRPALNTFLNDSCDVAPTFLLGRDGTIIQCVELWDGPQCNNTTEVGGKVPYTNSTSAIVRSRPYNANFYTYAIECVASGRGGITSIQFDAAVWLTKYIVAEHKKLYKTPFILDDLHSVGHCVINPGTRGTDPGPDFPLNQIILGAGGKITQQPKKQPIAYKEKDLVAFDGIAYRSCYGEHPAGTRAGTGRITKTYPKRFAPYRIGNIGFFTEGALTKLEESK